MIPDLERLVRLQQLDNEATAARRDLSDLPRRREALAAALEERQRQLTDARQRSSDNQASRRTIEKDLAAVQGRLAKFKDQLMAVKTNKEFHAVQKEMGVAEDEVRVFEDNLLQHMLAADELQASVKAAEIDLAAEETLVRQSSAQLDELSGQLEATRERLSRARETLTAQIDRKALALFETIAQKRGNAVVQARDGHCSACHVRLRPQMYNELRRNEQFFQCDNCGRLLYYVPPAAATQEVNSPPQAATS